MASHRMAHNAENIKREITAIMRELKDPRLHSGFISIVKIDAAEDASNCKVFVSALEGLLNAEKAVEGLKSAKGHIRTELGKRLHLKYLPTLSFHATDAVEYGINMSQKIEELISK